MNDIVAAPQIRTLGLIERELERDPRLVSGHTRRVYRQALESFETWRGGRAMTKLLAEEYAVEMRAAYAPATINRALSAIRWWAKRLRELAFEDPDMDPQMRDQVVVQAERVMAILNVKGTRGTKGRHLLPGEVRRLLTVCASDGHLAGLRDVALIATAWSTGARQAELAAIRVDDLVLDEDQEEAKLTIRHGKGDKQREISIFGSTYETLLDWRSKRGNAPGYVFCTLKKGDRLSHDRPLSHEAMRQLLIERADQAKITQAITWHDFRRTFIGNLLNANVDLATAQRLAGHSDPKTTSNYDRRAEEVQREAVQRLRLPYQRRTIDN